MTPLDLTLKSYGVLAALAPQARSYLCVGVADGECLRHVVQANPRLDEVVLCDTWGFKHGGTGRGSHKHIEAMLDRLAFAGHVYYLDGPSQQTVPALPADHVYDLTYVDGSHAEGDAYHDLRNVWRHTSMALVAHDARMPQVWAAITRFLDTARDAMGATYCNQGHGTLVVWR